MDNLLKAAWAWLKSRLWFLLLGLPLLIAFAWWLPKAVRSVQGGGLWYGGAVLATVILVPWLIVLLLLSLKKRRRRSKTQRQPRVSSPAPVEPARAERAQRFEVVKKHIVVHHHPGVMKTIVSLGLVFLFGYLVWLTNVQIPKHKNASAAPAASSLTTTVTEEVMETPPVARRVCDQIGRTEHVDAPISPENTKWSRYVYIHPSCTAMADIPLASNRYRYRCLDKDGKGPFLGETGKCDGGVTALSFQKVSPLTMVGEEVSPDEFWAPLPLEITFTQYEPSA